MLSSGGSGAGGCRRADLAQLVEQLFRKQQVWGSSPQVGSALDSPEVPRAEVAERQTRYVQGVVGVTPWEFKSPLRHPIPKVEEAWLAVPVSPAPGARPAR